MQKWKSRECKAQVRNWKLKGRTESSKAGKKCSWKTCLRSTLTPDETRIARKREFWEEECSREVIGGDNGFANEGRGAGEIYRQKEIRV